MSDRMSEYHKAIHDLNTLANNNETYKALDTVEDHNRILFTILKQIIADGTLKNPSTSTLKLLSDFGLVEFDESLIAHIHALTLIQEDLRQPTHAPEFFAKYFAPMTLITQHDLLATKLITTLLLHRQGLATEHDLDSAIQSYKENSDHLLLRVEE